MSILEFKNFKNLLESEIKKSSNVFIIGHNGPDFDSIGACIGLAVLAEHFHKDAYIIVNDKIIRMEPGVKKIIDDNRDQFSFITNEEFLRSKYDEILEFSELGEFINLPVKNYSSGMLSKLGFSIATIVEPDILILDEVLGVGDINFKKKSKEKLQALMESHTTVLLVSHSIKEIRNICDKAIWIDKGRVVDMGEVNSICDKYEEAAKTASKEKTKKLKPKRF